MTDDADDRTAARRAGDTETWDEKVVTDLMATPQGRFWMERLLDLTGARAPLYGNDGDALGMAWRDGKAEIGRYLETQLQAYCPDRYLQMIRERRARIKRQVEKNERDAARRDQEFVPTARTYVDDAIARESEEARKQPQQKPKNAR